MGSVQASDITTIVCIKHKGYHTCKHYSASVFMQSMLVWSVIKIV